MPLLVLLLGKLKLFRASFVDGSLVLGNKLSDAKATPPALHAACVGLVSSCSAPLCCCLQLYAALCLHYMQLT